MSLVFNNIIREWDGSEEEVAILNFCSSRPTIVYKNFVMHEVSKEYLDSIFVGMIL